MSDLGGFRIRIATWNILHGLDLRTGRVDLGVVHDTIAALQADVVGLQEVDRDQARSGGIDQLHHLAEALGWNGVFAPSLLGSPDTRWQRVRTDTGGPAYGIGLLTPHPIGGVRRMALPGGDDGGRPHTPTPGRPGWDREPRVALSADITVGELALEALCVHLSYMPWRGVRQLAHLLRARRPRGHAALMGDFNLPAWAVRIAARGWVHAGGQPTHPASDPRLQLDQILVRGGEPSSARVGTAAGSDHRPLVVDVALR